jgi:lysophospholipase L1-like esterase
MIMKGLNITYSFIIALLLLPLGLQGQSVKKVIPKYDFVNFSANQIQFLGDSSFFERVYDKLDSILFLGKGHLNIMHIGGSHVQAGVFTARLRNDLLSLGNDLDGGRGLVFPFSVARTNNPISFVCYRTGIWDGTRNVGRAPEHRLGLTGMAVTTESRKASISIVAVSREPKPEDPEFSFNTVKVIGYSERGGREPLIIYPEADTLKGEYSEDESSWTFSLPQLTDSVTITISDATGSFTLTGIYLDNGFPGITMTGIGVNGASVASYMKCADLQRDLKLVKPDLVLFAIGVNDASGRNFIPEDFKSRYSWLISQVRAASPDCSFIFITNNDNLRRVGRRSKKVNEHGPVVEKAFMDMAKEYGGGLWDLFGIMGGLGSVSKWRAVGMVQSDGVHFTNEGYDLIGDLLYNALMDRYLQHIQK